MCSVFIIKVIIIKKTRLEYINAINLDKIRIGAYLEEFGKYI